MKNFAYPCASSAAALALLIFASAARVEAQNNPFLAPSSAMDTLSEAPTGPSPAAAMDRTKNLPAAPAPGAPAEAPPAFGAPPPAFGAPAPAPAPAPGAPPAAAPAGKALGEAKDAVTRVFKPRGTKCVVGTRIFDPITRELLDDAQTVFMDEAEAKANLFDDGTHGDTIAGDGVYSLIDSSNENIGQGNQRLKERLIQAIYTAEQLSPLQFYGYHILTTERHDPVPRNRRWALGSAGSGRPGLRLSEVDTSEPVQMEKYRDKEQDRDKKVLEWALGFLNEYRKSKGDIASEFYPIHIPMPPVPPASQPPTEAGWEPFPNPEGPGETDTGASAVSKYGYKVKQPLPDIDGAAAGGSAYYDRKAFNKIYR